MNRLALIIVLTPAMGCAGWSTASVAPARPKPLTTEELYAQKKAELAHLEDEGREEREAWNKRHAENASAAAAELERAIAELKSKAPQTSEKAIAAIRANRVFLGMTAAEVRLSWGKPARINTTATEHSISEQWIYEARNSYLYLKDGKLIALQDTR